MKLCDALSVTNCTIDALRRKIQQQKGLLLSTGKITELLRSAEADLVPLAYGQSRDGRVAVPRFFAGYAEDYVAGIPGVSQDNVKRDGRFTKACSSWDMGEHNGAD
jgi:hypothetical protein